MAENPTTGRSRAGATSRHVATIIQAAEDAAQAIHVEAEERVNQRIAEGERAAQYRVRAAEEEATEILQAARDEAQRLRRDAQAEMQQAKAAATSQALTIMASVQEQADAALQEAADAAEASRRDAERRSRELVLDAHAATDGVRAEGLELVANLRQMGDSLRSNAERLLRDVQLIHTHMVARLDQAGGAAARIEDPSSRGGELDVPEFIPPS